MRILIDTNIALDLALKRDNYFETSKNAVVSALFNGHILYFSSSSVTDYYYILRNNKLSKKEALSSAKSLSRYVTFATVDEKCIYQAFNSIINDFEDAVIDSVATNINADIILTRNKKDFINSTNKVLTPEEFLAEQQCFTGDIERALDKAEKQAEESNKRLSHEEVFKNLKSDDK